MGFEAVYDIIQKKLQDILVPEEKEHIALEFHVTGENTGVFYVEIADGKVQTAPYEYYDRHGMFAADASVYLDICAGRLHPVTALATGRLRLLENNPDKTKILDFFQKCVDKCTCI